MKEFLNKLDEGAIMLCCLMMSLTIIVVVSLTYFIVQTQTMVKNGYEETQVIGCSGTIWKKSSAKSIQIISVTNYVGVPYLVYTNR